MDVNNLFCKICSYQFGKKLVYDIHMSLVHKIETDHFNSQKPTQQEDICVMKKEMDVKSDKNFHSLKKNIGF